jgi:signal transduction histidine kinase
MRSDRDGAIGAARRWRSSLRLRLTVAGTLLAAATFLTAGLLVLAVYHHTLVADQQAFLSGWAGHIADSAAQQGLPAPVPMPTGPAIPRLQVLDAHDQVITGDPVSINDPPMLTLGPGQNRRDITLINPGFLPDAHRVAVVAIRATGPAGPRTAVAASSLDPSDERARQAADLAALVFAISLIVVAAIAWLTVGRALRPVERLRAQVTGITERGDLSHRVPQPRGADELARLATTLNHMLGVLQQADQRQRQFIADAAHELRTPLAGINTFLDVAATHPGTVDRDTLVRKLTAAHNRLTTLVNDLLTLANLDAGAPNRHRPVDLGGVVTDCLRHAPAGTVEMRDQITAQAVVIGNEAHLARIVGNLLDNAVRHAESTVDVTLARMDGVATLTIADDGPGVPEGQRDRIWERFVRLDSDRDRTSGGTGLGLALVHELVAAHAGRVEVGDARPGAVFTVTIPLAPADPGEA